MVRKLLEDGEGLVGAAFRNVMGGDITGGGMSGGGMSGGGGGMSGGVVNNGGMSGGVVNNGGMGGGVTPVNAAVDDDATSGSGRAPSMSRMQRQLPYKINTNAHSYTISPLFVRASFKKEDIRMLPSHTF